MKKRKAIKTPLLPITQSGVLFRDISGPFSDGNSEEYRTLSVEKVYNSPGVPYARLSCVCLPEASGLLSNDQSIDIWRFE